MKRFLFYLGHPAHWHYVKNIVDELAQKGHSILLVAREKDVLLQLLEGVKHDVVVLPAKKGESKKALLTSTAGREIKMFRIARKFKPDVMIGTDIVITHIGRLLNIPSIVMSEDDASEIKLFVKYGYKYATHILAPTSCDCTPYNHKQIAYDGYAELNYLHPKYFSPNKQVVESLFQGKDKYFLLRFAQLNAFHDDGRKGIDNTLAIKLVELLAKQGSVHITSERTLPDKLEKYRISISPKQMHHAMAFASLYIGDSQTMAAEAAILGTPSIRFNDFVGKLGYLEELEHKYHLTFGISANHPEKLIEKVKSLLNSQGLKEEWKKRQINMLNQTMDVNAFMLWLFENYPQSAKKFFSNKTVANKFYSSPKKEHL